MTTAFVTHPAFLRHDASPGHPDRPERLTAIEDRFAASGLAARLRRIEAPIVDRDALVRVHPEQHLRFIERNLPTEGYVEFDPDTIAGPHSAEAIWRAAGAGVRATELVHRGELASAFCAVRPPGHHACRERVMGFCFINNVAVAAAHALDALGCARVAIVDFDAHHGNGTEDVFCGDARVLMVGAFEHPLYPYSGDRPLGANMVNVPLPAGAGGTVFRDAVRRQWLPALADHAPEMVFVSAGFDGHRDDPLCGLALSEDDYGWVTEAVLEATEGSAAGRVVSLLEGGYDVYALARSAEAHVRALARL